jgi:hypothetical protein
LAVAWQQGQRGGSTQHDSGGSVVVAQRQRQRGGGSPVAAAARRQHSGGNSLAEMQWRLSKGCALREAKYCSEIDVVVFLAVALHPQQASPNKVDEPLQLDLLGRFPVQHPTRICRVTIRI